MARILLCIGCNNNNNSSGFCPKKNNKQKNNNNQKPMQCVNRRGLPFGSFIQDRPADNNNSRRPVKNRGSPKRFPATEEKRTTTVPLDGGPGNRYAVSVSGSGIDRPP